MRSLLRSAKTKADDWISGAGDARVLSESVFQPKRRPRKEGPEVYDMSVYWADCEVEEARVAAAHLLTEPSPKSELSPCRWR